MIRQKLAVLCNDVSIRQIESAIASWFEVVHARDDRRLAVLAQHEAVRAVIIDQSCVLDQTIELLQRIKTIRPDVQRVLLTDHCKLAMIVQGIHSGLIDRIIYKPITDFEVISAVCPGELPRQSRRSAPRAAAAAQTNHV